MSALSDSISLIVDSVHELDLRRRAMFKSALREDFKGSCNENEAVTTPIFGDELSDTFISSQKLTKLPDNLLIMPKPPVQDIGRLNLALHHTIINGGCLFGLT